MRSSIQFGFVISIGRLLLVTGTALIVPILATTGAAQSIAQIGDLSTRIANQIKAGEFQNAAQTMETLIPLAEQAMGASNADVVRMRVQQAVMLRSAGDMDAALRAANNARRNARRRLGEHHAVTAAAVVTVGSVYRIKGDFQKAERFYRSGITTLQRLGVDGEKDLAEAWLNLAELLSESGQPADAEVILRKARSLVRRLHGADSVQAATAENNLGMTLMKLGRMDDAERTLQSSLKLHEQLYGRQHPEFASSLNNLGLLYVGRGRTDQATQAYQQALAVTAKLDDSGASLQATVQNNLGQLMSETGQTDAALPLLQSSLQWRREHLGEDHPSTGNAMHNLGAMYADTKKHEQGRRVLRQAITTLTTAHGDAHPAPVRSLAYLGILETTAGEDHSPDAAIDAFDRARRMANAAAWKVLPKLASTDQQQFMQRTFDWTLYASLALADRFPDNQNVIDASAQWLANGKGIAETALAAARNPEMPTPQWTSMEAIRNSIPTDGLLIDFVRQDLFDYDATTLRERLRDPHYVAWIIPRDGDIERVDLGDAATIDDLIVEARSSITNAAKEEGTLLREGEAAAEQSTRAAMDQLATKIWQPIASSLKPDTRRIILSPDSALWLVPFAALPVERRDVDDANQPGYLVEQYAISTIGSSRDLVGDDRQERDSSDSLNNDSLSNASKPTIFSNPTFSQSAADKAAAYRRLFRRTPAAAEHGTPSAGAGSKTIGRTRFSAAPLPGTDAEAKAILAPIATWLGGVAPHHFKGPYALESVARQLKRPPVLVFATHGFFRGELTTKRAVNPDGSVPLGDKSLDANFVDPLSQCGLLLSGCNDAAADCADDDGILTGVEITDLKLAGTKLVVLSACDTGIGKIENGNGIAGLRRAFHLAGASSVASTLWQIPDEDTALLMADFFNGLADGKSFDVALQSAQRKRIQSHRKSSGASHPFFWAAFTVSVK